VRPLPHAAAARWGRLSDERGVLQSMATAWGEDEALEIDALYATYGEDVVSVDPGARCVSLALVPPRPSAEESTSQHFLEFKLRLTLPVGYPYECSNAMRIELLQPRGLSSERLSVVASLLEAEAASLTGEMAMGAVFDAAREWLGNNDIPEGMCVRRMPGVAQL
jgi:RWD domain